MGGVWRPGARRGAGAKPDGPVQGEIAAAEVGREIEVVHAEVHQDAARAGLRRAHPSQVDRQNGLALDELGQGPHHRVEPLGVSDEEPRPRPGGGARRSSFPGRRAHRLLDQDVSAGREPSADDGPVRLDRRGDDDDLGAAQRFGLAAEAVGSLGRRGACPGIVSSHELEMAVHGPQHPCVALSHRAEADEGHLVTSRRPSAHSTLSAAPPAVARPPWRARRGGLHATFDAAPASTKALPQGGGFSVCFAMPSGASVQRELTGHADRPMGAGSFSGTHRWATQKRAP